MNNLIIYDIQTLILEQHDDNIVVVINKKQY